MQRRLTAKQKANLALAIRRAKGPGHCDYEDAGKPCCVIGQLASIEGVSIDTLRDWDNHSWGAEVIRAPFVTEYGRPLLRKIQRVWDEDAPNIGERKARAEMRKLACITPKRRVK